MDVEKIKENLKQALDRDSVSNWITTFLKNLNVEDVKKAVDSNLSLVKLAFNHWHLSHPLVKPFARFVLKLYFNDLYYTLSNVPLVYKELIKNNPKLKEVLDTPKGRAWLNKQCESLRNTLYNYVWCGIDPLGDENPYKKKNS
ncbi:hypothetical protein J7K27_02970 [Candidatus Bathyarchaeota archaeon]|nr:hypothetical protein [Candidatus Bathyarchaeota archaeon]